MGTTAAAAEACARSAARSSARTDDWRRQASHLRDHAVQPHLALNARAVLLREAVAADKMADWWVAGAEDDQR